METAIDTTLQMHTCELTLSFPYPPLRRAFGWTYCRFPKIAPRVRKLFWNMSFTLGEEPPLTLGEELQTARYQLYRSQILQVNIRWKALAEIYTMHMFAVISKFQCIDQD